MEAITLRIPWGTPVERERRMRIRLSVYAYAYEYHARSLVPDAVYDILARCIQPSVATGAPVLDQFFQQHYSPDTGMWIRQHPDLAGVSRLYHRYYQ